MFQETQLSLRDRFGHVNNLLKEHGQDTLSYFHLQDDRKYFFSPSGKAFLSFKTYNSIALVGADPVGPKKEMRKLFKSYMVYLRTWHYTPCFLSISTQYISILKSLGFQTHKIGEEAIVNLDTFERKRLKKKVRRAVRHIENLGIDIFFFSPNQLPKSIAGQLKNISKKWVQAKGTKEKGFSMTLRRLPNMSDSDCKLAVAIKGSLVVGYLSFVPIYQKRGVSLDFIRQRRGSPNGLNEFLIIKSAEFFKQRNVQCMSLNFAGFTDTHASKVGMRNRTVSLLFKLLSFFYKSQSLRIFNEKFLPRWEDRYVAYPSRKKLPLYILAIARAERY